MRLINTVTLQLEEFFDSNRPAYAILSHTWGRDEVSFQEWLEWQDGSASQRARIESKRGFQKIQDTCRIARGESYDFVWVDTNCIDKKSSAELTEAINSMFAWYRDSAMCFVYLEDYLDAPKDDIPGDAFGTCRWFTRGWTLQELLAPTSMLFYNRSWECIGSKDGLIFPVKFATDIDFAILNGMEDLRDACVAKKMSWASKRQTSRVEDTAYCLLGIFGINMPLLYGEGIEAFRRLQEEIIKVSTDQSIFAWDWPNDMDETGRDHWVSLLAPHPGTFRNCFDIKAQNFYGHEFMLTNRGLSMTIPPLHTQYRSLVYGVLECYRIASEGWKDLICIPLLVGASTSTNSVSRRDGKLLVKLNVPSDFVYWQPTSIRVPRLSQDDAKNIWPAHWHPASKEYERAMLQLFYPVASEQHYFHISVFGQELIDGDRSMTTIHSIGDGLDKRHPRGFCVNLCPRGAKTQTALVVLWSQDFAWTQVCFTLYGDFYDPQFDGGSISQRVLDHVWTKTRSLPPTSTASQSAVEISIRFSDCSRNGFGDVVFPVRCTGDIEVGLGPANGLRLYDWVSELEGSLSAWELP